jgi:hypothetical protein
MIERKTFIVRYATNIYREKNDIIPRTIVGDLKEFKLQGNFNFKNPMETSMLEEAFKSLIDTYAKRNEEGYNI